MFVHKDGRVFENGNHLFLVSYKIRGEVTVIELHTVYDIENGFCSVGFLDSDNTVRTNLVHGIGDHITDFGIAVSGDGTNLGDGLLIVYLNGILIELIDDSGNSFIDSALHFGRIGAGCNNL